MALTIGQMILWGTNSPPAEVSTGDSNTNVDIKFSVLNKGLNEYFILYQGYNHVTSKSCMIQSNSTVYTVFFGL